MTFKKKYDEIKKVIIYELICFTTNQRYIGSTYNFLRRKKEHKNYKKNVCQSKNIIKNNNYQFNIIEEFYCKYELSTLLKEQYYLDNLENINKKRALRLTNKKKIYQKQYINNNKNKVSKYFKEYYLKNQNKFLQKYICVCGVKLCNGNKARHNKTKYHLDYLRKNTI